MALKINLYKNKQQSSRFFGKVYGRVENAKPIGIDELAQHMSEHNTPYSQGAIKGVLTDMTRCIKELMLQGQPVKLADLAIFKASVESAPANDAQKFDLDRNIRCVKLCAMATGIVTRKQLTADGILELTNMAQKIHSGELELSNEKGKYLTTDTASGD